nr:hypothetical protein [Micromonospora sp. DSM 115978]
MRPGPDRDGYPGGPRPGVGGPERAAYPGDPRPGAGGPERDAGDEVERGGVHDDPDEDLTAGQPVPVRRLPSLIVAGFALLIGVGLVFGAQTSAPGARLPFALVVLGVQLLFVLAWTMALRPPALLLVAGVSTVVAASANAAAVLPDLAALAPLGYVAAGGFLVGVIGQLIRPKDRARVTESLGATLFIIIGVVAFATLIVLSRRLLGTQAIFVCLTATAVALAVARFTDAVLAWPRPAPQVPRGAAGVVVGAMCGTLAGGVIGIYLVGFTPTSGAVVGLVAGSAAVLADLAVGYIEAGRQMAGEPPTTWIARHMQGPLGGFALAAPVAYGMSVLLL